MDAFKHLTDVSSHMISDLRSINVSQAKKLEQSESENKILKKGVAGLYKRHE